jgi:hypothetical protein
VAQGKEECIASKQKVGFLVIVYIQQVRINYLMAFAEVVSVPTHSASICLSATLTVEMLTDSVNSEVETNKSSSALG